MTDDTMHIWNAVERTDFGETKNFDTGKFKGTAVCLMYNAKRATELFGPYGHGWTATIVKDELVTVGNPEAPDTIHTLHVLVRYRHGEEWGEALGIGNTPVAYKTSKGYWTVDHDYAKKSFTDALSKALSYLGFSADVYMGKFDDDRYVAEAKRRAKEATGAPQPPQDARVDAGGQSPPPRAPTRSTAAPQANGGKKTLSEGAKVQIDAATKIKNALEAVKPEHIMQVWREQRANIEELHPTLRGRLEDFRDKLLEEAPPAVDPEIGHYAPDEGEDERQTEIPT